MIGEVTLHSGEIAILQKRWKEVQQQFEDQQQFEAEREDRLFPGENRHRIELPPKRGKKVSTVTVASSPGGLQLWGCGQPAATARATTVALEPP